MWKDWIALLWSRSRSQERLRIPSQRYLLNRWTFCNQTWYGDAPSWTRVLCKKIDLLFSSSGSHWRLIWSNMWLFLIYIYGTADLFTPKFSKMAHNYKLERLFSCCCCCCCCCVCVCVCVCVCLKIRLLFSRSRSQGRSKTVLNLCILYLLYHWSLGSQIFWADLLLLITKPSTKSGHILRIEL